MPLHSPCAAARPIPRLSLTFQATQPPFSASAMQACTPLSIHVGQNCRTSHPAPPPSPQSVADPPASAASRPAAAAAMASVKNSQNGDQNVRIVTVRRPGPAALQHALVSSRAWHAPIPRASCRPDSRHMLLSLIPASRPCPYLHRSSPSDSSPPRPAHASQVSPTVKAVAGSIGGVVEACMLQPIDVMKTRLQLDHSGHYKGAPHACASPAAGRWRPLLATSWQPALASTHLLTPTLWTIPALPTPRPCRHDPLRPHDCAGGGHQEPVEGADAIRGAADAQVRAAHGLQCFLPGADAR